jgi:hypothetical protein
MITSRCSALAQTVVGRAQLWARRRSGGVDAFNFDPAIRQSSQILKTAGALPSTLATTRSMCYSRRTVCHSARTGAALPSLSTPALRWQARKSIGRDEVILLRPGCLAQPALSAGIFCEATRRERCSVGGPVSSSHARREKPASSTAMMPVRKMPSKVPAPPIEATGAPSPRTASRLRRSAPISVPRLPLT